LSLFISIALFISLLGLVKKIKIARFSTVIVMGGEAVHLLIYGLYASYVDKEDPTIMIIANLILQLIIYLPFIFLAYKIYSSKELKAYLSKPYSNIVCIRNY